MTAFHQPGVRDFLYLDGWRVPAFGVDFLFAQRGGHPYGRSAQAGSGNVGADG